jgi:hypothetical protein
MVNTELSGSPDCLLIPVDQESTLGAQHVGLLVFIHVLHGNNEYNLGGVGERGDATLPPPPPSARPRLPNRPSQTNLSFPPTHFCIWNPP